MGSVELSRHMRALGSEGLHCSTILFAQAQLGLAHAWHFFVLEDALS
jgi:hypothetical protein